VSTSNLNLKIRKAAILLLSLPQEQAARLLARLDALQVEAVAVEIARSERFTVEEQAAVIREFADVDPRTVSAGKGGLRVANALVERALGADDPLLKTIHRSIESQLFEFLTYVDSQDLLKVLADEHPQTGALVVSHMPRSRAAHLVARMSGDRQLAVLRGIAARGHVELDVVEEVARGIARRLSHAARGMAEKSDAASPASPSLFAA
jgi:flagellar motor switch protein FliG